jgi:hypothetical protein
MNGWIGSIGLERHLGRFPQFADFFSGTREERRRRGGAGTRRNTLDSEKFLDRL